ncbi:Cytochrome P450 97B3, chloroplastic [Cytospora mali]|uniref:Cytochrome P450 97B3, chloroplastic n=1 Tax=Cytospora mali TaxID=578113 RepID=A0A194VT18_CYTMA|nr:Cytochrome P450 97B3, chloroplastic [Valsa mali]
MGFPWKGVTAIAATTAYIATFTLKKGWAPSAFLGYFASSWIICLACYAVWSAILYPKFFSPLIGLPEPKNPSWINGQYAKIKELPTGWPMLEWVRTVPNDGLIRYLSLLNQERLLVTSPKALAEVLVTKNYEFTKPGMVAQSIGRILGVGILLAEGDEHKFQRKNLMPAFAFRHVKDLYPVFWQKSREGVQAMTRQILADAAKEEETPSPITQDPEQAASEKISGGKTAILEVGVWASRITLDIVGVAGLGRDFGAIADPTNELFKTYNNLFRPSAQAQFLVFLSLIIPMWLVTHLPVRRNGDIQEAARLIRNICYDLIREKKEKLARKELTDVDILSVALESGGFTEDNLVDQLMTFLAAGHETTASSMTWAIYMLCRYPEVQAKLRREVREHLPSIDDDGGANISSMDIDRMPYLNAVCSEVLRYYAPVPMTMREAAVDTTIQGHRVPKGTRIIMSPAVTNKDARLWGPDAAEFNPDRWMPRHEGDKSAASGGASSNYAFLTFLHGPRSCIGMAFAKAEFACLLAAWVGRVAFELRDLEEMDEMNMKINGGVTSKPAKGLWVKATVLDGW